MLFRYTKILLCCALFFSSCTKEFLELEPRGTTLETNFYQTQEDFFEGLVAVYDVLQWGGTNNEWSMLLGLTNAASDDCHAGGSDASDQPNWVAWDAFNLNPDLGPQRGLWTKYYSGIYRANLLLEKLDEIELDPVFEARTRAEAQFLRGFFYFDLVRLFGNIPLITNTLSADEILSQTQSPPEAIYVQIEEDLKAALNTFELPETVPPGELGRVTRWAVSALLGKVILYQNDNGRMLEAAGYLQDVINSNAYMLEPNFGDIFNLDNEFGPESIFEIQHSGNQRGGWENFINGTEGNYAVQFFGMRDYVGPIYSNGWSFCPVSEDLFVFMQGDPRLEHTIINGNLLRSQGAEYTEGFQNTNFFIRKYAGLQTQRPGDGEPALNWGHNIKEIRLADVLLMAAEAILRGGGNIPDARDYLNRVRTRVGIPPTQANGQALLGQVYSERRKELATEGHRYFDLVRTGQAATILGPQGYVDGVHQWLPIPQIEIDLSENSLVQNPGY